MHDDLLPRERRIEVRHDANPPRIADEQRLGRRAVLAAPAERALRELLLRRRIELGLRRSRTLRPRRSDGDAPAG
jgi:hypothetical protein